MGKHHKQNQKPNVKMKEMKRSVIHIIDKVLISLTYTGILKQIRQKNSIKMDRGFKDSIYRKINISSF